ncbi:NOL1/NOP2/sun domain protein [Sphaerulina musiva SO2202]|uniref:NOL1/NOP2/sun domain protein n=1 Tax=Sphaerulina musiva (strain SO2202) TaxID=692275 RepID=M3B6Y4_SPHMS|nr:NOL1/NOP2/sun domain protein [Sphaerulina musiva SO2202]EMF15582.1 NOL1/NOP2/sun domain protein [Sphaerulina musiva SO2202]
MSLYHESAEILAASQKNGGSLKSLVFGKKTWKSDPKALYALTTETAKWSTILSEVLEKSGLLKIEKKLTPILALLLVHDLFLAKKGIALPATHGLHSSISRHKARLSAELTKARIRRGFGSLDDLRKDVEGRAISHSSSDGSEIPTRHPRWIRINTLKTSLEEELKEDTGAFSTFTQAKSLKEIIQAAPTSRLVYIDENIPDLVAIASPEEPTTFKAYRCGKLILQEKASCFPAYLLDYHSSPEGEAGDVIDACAAPGNKTTHIAAIVRSHNGTGRVFACERDPERSKTLSKMTKIAGADEIVTIKAKQDFTRLDPTKKEFANVKGLILDPSCSGSGIFGRDEGTIVVRLPSLTAIEENLPKGKKRKRGGKNDKPQEQKPPAELETQAAAVEEEIPDDENQDDEKLQKRLENLAGFQLSIIKHAMAFPSAERITYSTCSLHGQENEEVVVKALLSDIAKRRGWRILKRREQVEGMQKWHKRGDIQAVGQKRNGDGAKLEVAEVADACIRCDKGGEDGTMGFFVAGFVRDESSAMNVSEEDHAAEVSVELEDNEAEWGGFSEDES